MREILGKDYRITVNQKNGYEISDLVNDNHHKYVIVAQRL